MTRHLALSSLCSIPWHSYGVLNDCATLWCFHVQTTPHLCFQTLKHINILNDNTLDVHMTLGCHLYVSWHWHCIALVHGTRVHIHKHAPACGVTNYKLKCTYKAVIFMFIMQLPCV